MNNILVKLQSGELILIYTETLGTQSCKLWAEIALHTKVEDSFICPDNELQYYCIDDRLWNTPEDDEKVRNLIKRHHERS